MKEVVAVQVLIVSVFFMFCESTALGAEADSDFASGNKDSVPASIIDPNVAAFVAADYLPAFYWFSN